MEKELIKTTPFDQFSRQSLVVKILEACRQGKEKLNLLDVGGYKGRTKDFLPHDNVTILDLFDVEEDGYVKGSALEMPFNDDSFDFVLSFDVLEHIAAEDRKRFLSECNRVAKHGIVIAAPHDTPLNSKSEIELNNIYESMHYESHRWLKEHIDNGLPKFDEVARSLENDGWKTCVFPSNDMQLWVLMQGAIFANSKFPMSSEKIVELNEYYNTELINGDGGLHPEEAYRFVLVAVKDSSLKAALKRKIKISEIPFTIRQGLINKLNEYYIELLSKTQQLADNYKDLHQHELTRATTLQANNEKLIADVMNLEQQHSGLGHKFAHPIESARKITKKKS